MRNKMAGLVICLVIVGISAIIPLKKEINIEKTMKHSFKIRYR